MRLQYLSVQSRRTEMTLTYRSEGPQALELPLDVWPQIRMRGRQDGQRMLRCRARERRKEINDGGCRQRKTETTEKCAYLPVPLYELWIFRVRHRERWRSTDDLDERSHEALDARR